MSTNRINRTFRAFLATATMLLAATPMSMADGPIVAWGRDDYGQVSGVPAGNFKAVAAGPYGNCVAIRSDGTLAAWGFVGVEPLLTPPPGVFTAVAAGWKFCVGIRDDGTLVAWGQDIDGVISNVPSGTFRAVSALGRHCVAIRTDGTLVAWGIDTAGEISQTPTGSFVAIAAGFIHNVAIRSDGSLVGWGDDHSNQRHPPAGTFRFVTTYDDYSLAISTDGTIAGWGFPPFETPISGSYLSASADIRNALCLRTDGTLVTFGLNDSYGQVSGTPSGLYSQVAASGLSSFAIVAGPSEQLTYLSNVIDEYSSVGDVSPQAANSLDAKVDAALAALARGNANDARRR